MSTNETPSSSTTTTMLPVELTLVLAATRNMGIGRAGTLPWTGLKKEMAYFARVTKRLPSSSSPATATATNAVIMGRKTWESIPPKFRPLKDRLNIVISRQLSSQPEPGVVWTDSLEGAIQHVRDAGGVVGRVFVIGGAQIYGAALQMREARRILLTKVMSDFECDVFFPLVLAEAQEGSRWTRRSKEELDGWVGETVPEGVQEENGTEYEFQMWERLD